MFEDFFFDDNKENLNKIKNPSSRAGVEISCCKSEVSEFEMKLPAENIKIPSNIK